MESNSNSFLEVITVKKKERTSSLLSITSQQPLTLSIRELNRRTYVQFLIFQKKPQMYFGQGFFTSKKVHIILDNEGNNVRRDGL